jgi:NADPH-dependent 2,4-dienoyl-CoA reductase/sulfur reductase-like enzyme
MANQFKYIIVGGGAAGASAIEGIRQRDQSGSVALFSKEPHLPYDRPPLSKGLWMGKATVDQLPLHEESFYRTNAVRVHLGAEVVDVDPRRKQIQDQDGSKYNYDKLLLATGGSPRMLSFGNEILQYYRTVDDFLSLQEATGRLQEFVILGGGFIGGELAAALANLKKTVTMVFPEERLLQRLLPNDLGSYVTRYYGEKGVTVLSGDVPTGVSRSGGKITLTTKSGKRLSADVAIAAIGLNLHTEMAKRAGLKLENGITVNSFLQTSDPNIYAAGDIAYFPSKSLDKSIRIEHWNNAQMQGKHAGANMAGANAPYDYLPYFWSDLFDLGFEAVGELDSRLTTYADWKEEFREGVVYYLDEGRVKGVLLWNVWEKVDAARNLVNKKRVYKYPEELKGRL